MSKIITQKNEMINKKNQNNTTQGTSIYLHLQRYGKKSIWFGKKQLKKYIEKGNIEQRAKDIHTIATVRTLTSNEETELITMYENITAIVLKAKNHKGIAA